MNWIYPELVEGRTLTPRCSLPSTRARLPLPHNNRTIGADNRESPTIQMLDFDQFLSEVRYCHQLQKDSCRAGL